MMLTCPSVEKRVEELTRFVLLNRTGKVFAKYSEQEIRDELRQADNEGLLYIARDDSERIVAFCSGSFVGNRVHVNNCISILPGSLGLIAKAFAIDYPDMQIQAHRYGHVTKYNTKRLLYKLSRLSKN